MNTYIIKKYIKTLTKDKLYNLAINYNIKLNDNETTKIYNYIKNNYQNYFNNILSKDKILKDLETILTPINYKKLNNLYNIYKDKI